VRPRQLATLAGFWLAFFVPSCQPGDRQTQSGTARAEAAWLDGIDDWLSSGVRGSSSGCRSSFFDRVGPAPSPGLRRLEALAGTLCDRIERWRSDERKALTTGDDDLYLKSRRELDAVDAAYREVDDFLAAYRPGIGPQKLRRIAAATGESRIEPTFSKVAQALSRTRVRVRCWSKADWPRLAERFQGADSTFDLLGYADDEAERIDLAPSVCRPLADFAYGARKPDELDLADAVETLAHEATHIGPTPMSEEDMVECYALQHMRIAAVRLGASHALAARLSHLYWHAIYPTLPPQYRSAACRENGSLDLHVPGAPWD